MGQDHRGAGWASAPFEAQPAPSICLPDLVNFYANITLTVPENAEVRLLEKGIYESVTLERSADLRCTWKGVQARATFTAKSEKLLGLLGGFSRNAEIEASVTKPYLLGLLGEQVLAESSGNMRDGVVVDLLIPTRGKVC